jgi:hypothetical protein
VQGSSVNANNNTSLAATGEINLLAAADTASQTSNSKSSSSSAGIAASVGKDTKFGYTASIAGSRGNADGQDLTYANTNVNAGNVLSMRSGGNTTLAGAVVSGNTVNANVGGNLVIQSLQDKSTYDSKDTSFGVTAVVGAGAGASVSLGKTTVTSNFQSVNQTSGIRAGDGGFNVQVNGNTTLVGGQITSSANAAAAGINTFKTNGTLTTSDINNSSEFDAKSVSVTVGVGGQAAASGAGIGGASGSQSSKTVSAISAGNISVGGVRTNTSSNGNSLNTNTTTGQNDSGIKNTFNAADVKADVQAQVTITKAFGQQAAQGIGSYADQKLKEARAKNPPDQDAIDAWSEGGSSRAALHAIAGAMSGGLSGALGAGTVSAAAPLLETLQTNMMSGLVNAGMSPEAALALSKGLTQTVAMGVGFVAGGGSAAGAATGLNTDANNRLSPTAMRRKLDLEAIVAKTCSSEASLGNASGCGAAQRELKAINDLDAATGSQDPRVVAAPAKNNDQKCATAECAAGVLPTKSDNRSQAEIDADMKKLAIGVVAAPIVVAATIYGGPIVLPLIEQGGTAALATQTTPLAGGVTALTTTQLATATGLGATMSTGIEFFSNPNASPASLTAAAIGGAATGFLKLNLNAAAGAANPLIPFVPGYFSTNLVNQGLALAVGTGVKQDVNVIANNNAGTSWWTQPVATCSPIPPRKPC